VTLAFALVSDTHAATGEVRVSALKCLRSGWVSSNVWNLAFN